MHFALAIIYWQRRRETVAAELQHTKMFVPHAEYYLLSMILYYYQTQFNSVLSVVMKRNKIRAVGAGAHWKM